MKIDKKHPRYLSLSLREKLVRGVKMGLTSEAGLIAHGRGEAFDYLIGEATNSFAQKAITTAAALLLTSKRPIISVNGNSAVLCRNEFIALAKILNCKIEVNLFHFSIKRITKIEQYFRMKESKCILSYQNSKKITIPGIASKRAIMIGKGIGECDSVLVPLEDGDRCEALVKQGKKVIAIDLNPISRTARAATVTIVDNIARCLPKLALAVKKLKKIDKEKLTYIIREYNNNDILDEAIAKIRYH